jgi:hypothetical protein
MNLYQCLFNYITKKNSHKLSYLDLAYNNYSMDEIEKVVRGLFENESL